MNPNATRHSFSGALLIMTVLQSSLVANAAEWTPAVSPLMTRWAQDVSPQNALTEYPRPQLVRDRWVNLNGLRNYAIAGIDDAQPGEWNGDILVPFAIESALSGVSKSVQPGQTLWYRRNFPRPDLKDGGRLLLHFGAVDWHATVWINGRPVAEYAGIQPANRQC